MDRERAANVLKLFDKYDRLQRLLVSLSDSTNWVWAITVGTFLLLLTNYDKFAINNIFLFKWLLIMGFILIGISAMLVTAFRAMLYLKQLVLDTAIGNAEELPDKFDLEKDIKSEEDMDKMFSNIMVSIRAATMLGQIRKLISRYVFLMKSGWFCYIAGLIIIGVYFIIVLIKYA